MKMKRNNSKKHSNPEKKQDITDKPATSDSLRLNKYISHAGICSRRDADQLITDGKVTVNGTVITEMGYKVMPQDQITVDGKKIQLKKFVYILLNKPKGYITTTEDPENRKTVMELLTGATRERIYPVGRLDRNTSGLLLFTNDGELTNSLIHPSHNIPKIYAVTLDKALAKPDYEKIMQGVELEDGMMEVDELEYIDDKNPAELGIQIHSGKNRIVRRLFNSIGYEVVKLDRVMFGILTKRDLPRGKWRHLTETEVRNLKSTYQH